MSGPGGVGKSTIAKELARRDASLWLSRSWTTRPPRSGENEEAYVFVGRETFEKKVASGGFVEWAEFSGNLYGTPIPDLPAGKDLLLEIDVQGAAQVRAQVPDAVVILVVAPSWDATAERLRTRGDDESSVSRRLAIGRREEAEGRVLADHVVVNDDLDTTMAAMADIIAAHRSEVGHGKAERTNEQKETR